MFRVFLYTSLLLLVASSAFSAPIQLNIDDDDDSLINTDLDEYINDDNNNEDLLNDKLSDLGVNVESRGNGYKKVLTFVKTLQDSIDKEHTDLTRIFNGQTQEHNERKKQLDQARNSVEGLRKSLQNTQWKIANLTNSLTKQDDETSKVQKTIHYHKQLLKEEIEGLNKFYVESDKYKNYKEFPEIKSQIDELKNSVQKEVTDVIDVYSKLHSKLNNNIATKKKELGIFKQQEKTFNASLNTQTTQYSNLFNSFQKFVDLYNTNKKQYNSAKDNYNDEKVLLAQLSGYLQQTNPEKCIQVTQDYNSKVKSNEELTKQVKQLEEKNKSLTKQLDTLHKEIKTAVNKSKSVDKNTVVPSKQVSAPSKKVVQPKGKKL
jgi:chromosome segregation ATPase